VWHDAAVAAPQRLGPATSADVAALAGVSRATVSQILNGRDARFPEATRAKVRAAAAELDYRPSPAGRSLVMGRSDTIVVVAPNTTIGANIQDAVERIAEDVAGANVVLRFADDDADTTVSAILNLRPMAVVDLGAVPPEARTRLADRGVPVVPRLDVSLDEERPDVQSAIAELQVRELCRGEDRTILYAASADRRPDPFGVDRFAAMVGVCERLGLPAPLRVPVPVDEEGAQRALQPFLDRTPIGVAAYNDAVALAVLAGAARLGLAVPEQIAVIGMDRMDVAQLWAPRLTTVEFDMNQLIDAVIAQLDLLVHGTETRAPRHPDRALLTLVRGGTT
jgi:DNA-binding LacI/PurR family transcriptional regulator